MYHPADLCFQQLPLARMIVSVVQWTVAVIKTDDQ